MPRVAPETAERKKKFPWPVLWLCVAGVFIVVQVVLVLYIAAAPTLTPTHIDVLRAFAAVFVAMISLLVGVVGWSTVTEVKWDEWRKSIRYNVQRVVGRRPDAFDEQRRRSSARASTRRKSSLAGRALDRMVRWERNPSAASIERTSSRRQSAFFGPKPPALMDPSGAPRKSLRWDPSGDARPARRSQDEPAAGASSTGTWGGPRERATSDDMPADMPEELKKLLTGRDEDDRGSFDPANWEYDGAIGAEAGEEGDDAPDGSTRGESETPVVPLAWTGENRTSISLEDAMKAAASDE
jgi:hypothetical protein